MIRFRKLQTCPVCYGYRLESQFCHRCNGSGFIFTESERNYYLPLPQIQAGGNVTSDCQESQE